MNPVGVVLAVLAVLVAAVLYLVLCAGLLVLVGVPVALVLAGVGALVGALGCWGLVVGSLVAGDGDRELPPDRARPPHVLEPGPAADPAWRHYLAAQGPADAAAAVGRVRHAVGRLWAGLHRVTVRVLRRAWPVLWPLAPLPYVAGAAVAVAAAAAGAVAAVVVGVPAGVWWLVRSAAVGVLRRVDRGRLRRAGSAATCTGCGEVTVLPVVECPHCRRRHHQLVPGVHGLVRRRCVCGGLMAASAVAAAWSSPALRCPRCERGLPPGSLTGTDVRIAVVGAAGAGVSLFVAAGLDAVAAAVDTATVLDPPNGLATSPGTCTSLRVPQGTLHVLDVSGAVWDVPAQRRRLHLLPHVQGFVLVIDPIALPRLAARAGREEVDPEHVYRLVVGHLLAQRVPLRDHDLAVVVTRADELDACFRGRGPRPGSDGIRDWLRTAGLDNLLLALGRDFGTVRFFLTAPAPGAWDGPAEVLRWLAGRAGLRLPAAGPPVTPDAAPPAPDGAPR